MKYFFGSLSVLHNIKKKKLKHNISRKSPNVISVVLGEHDHTKTDESEQLNVDVAE